MKSRNYFLKLPNMDFYFPSHEKWGVIVWWCGYACGVEVILKGPSELISVFTHVFRIRKND
jgi:hypothetical protein